MCLKYKESKLDIEYPAVIDESRTLVGVFSLEYYDPDLDKICLGKLEIGFVQENGDKFEFYPIDQIEKPYPARQSYAEVWQDILTHIANDLDLAIEFTIAVQNKLGKANED